MVVDERWGDGTGREERGKTSLQVKPKENSNKKIKKYSGMIAKSITE